MGEDKAGTDRLRTGMAIVVEGRDDVDAVSRACSDLIIPTHGFGISETTWNMIAKAYSEMGIIILTDPDHAGEKIRQRLTERFPKAVQCYMAREDAKKAGDIGIENARPEMIRAALERALCLHKSSDRSSGEGKTFSGKEPFREVDMKDLTELGLAGTEDASRMRASVTRELGIGYCNAKALVSRLRGFGIGYEELAEAVARITEYNEKNRT